MESSLDGSTILLEPPNQKQSNHLIRMTAYEFLDMMQDYRMTTADESLAMTDASEIKVQHIGVQAKLTSSNAETQTRIQMIDFACNVNVLCLHCSSNTDLRIGAKCKTCHNKDADTDIAPTMQRASVPIIHLDKDKSSILCKTGKTSTKIVKKHQEFASQCTQDSFLSIDEIREEIKYVQGRMKMLKNLMRAIWHRNNTKLNGFAGKYLEHILQLTMILTMEFAHHRIAQEKLKIATDFEEDELWALAKNPYCSVISQPTDKQKVLKASSHTNEDNCDTGIVFKFAMANNSLNHDQVSFAKHRRMVVESKSRKSKTLRSEYLPKTDRDGDASPLKHMRAIQLTSSSSSNQSCQLHRRTSGNSTTLHGSKSSRKTDRSRRSSSDFSRGMPHSKVELSDESRNLKSSSRTLSSHAKLKASINGKVSEGGGFDDRTLKLLSEWVMKSAVQNTRNGTDKLNPQRPPDGAKELANKILNGLSPRSEFSTQGHGPSNAKKDPKRLSPHGGTKMLTSEMPSQCSSSTASRYHKKPVAKIMSGRSRHSDLCSPDHHRMDSDNPLMDPAPHWVAKGPLSKRPTGGSKELTSPKPVDGAKHSSSKVEIARTAVCSLGSLLQRLKENTGQGASQNGGKEPDIGVCTEGRNQDKLDPRLHLRLKRMADNFGHSYNLRSSQDTDSDIPRKKSRKREKDDGTEDLQSGSHAVAGASHSPSTSRSVLYPNIKYGRSEVSRSGGKGQRLPAEDNARDIGSNMAYNKSNLSIFCENGPTTSDPHTRALMKKRRAKAKQHEERHRRTKAKKAKQHEERQRRTKAKKAKQHEERQIRMKAKGKLDMGNCGTFYKSNPVNSDSRDPHAWTRMKRQEQCISQCTVGMEKRSVRSSNVILQDAVKVPNTLPTFIASNETPHGDPSKPTKHLSPQKLSSDDATPGRSREIRWDTVQDSPEIASNLPQSSGPQGGTREPYTRPMHTGTHSEEQNIGPLFEGKGQRPPLDGDAQRAILSHSAEVKKSQLSPVAQGGITGAGSIPESPHSAEASRVVTESEARDVVQEKLWTSERNEKSTSSLRITFKSGIAAQNLSVSSQSEVREDEANSVVSTVAQQKEVSFGSDNAPQNARRMLDGTAKSQPRDGDVEPLPSCQRRALESNSTNAWVSIHSSGLKCSPIPVHHALQTSLQSSKMNPVSSPREATSSDKNLSQKKDSYEIPSLLGVDILSPRKDLRKAISQRPSVAPPQPHTSKNSRYTDRQQFRTFSGISTRITDRQDHNFDYFHNQSFSDQFVGYPSVDRYCPPQLRNTSSVIRNASNRIYWQTRDGYNYHDRWQEDGYFNHF